eukprot:EG_transcript_4000
MVDDQKRASATANAVLQQLRCANQLAISTSEKAREAIESSANSLVTQQHTLEQIEERLAQMGYLVHLRSLEAMDAGAAHASKNRGFVKQLDFPDLPNVPMLDDLHGQPSTQLISPRACMRSEESLFSPINMQIVPSPPPSDVFVFGNTPRTGSPRSLAGSPLMSVQPSFEAQLQLQYADGLALPAALPSGSLLHMLCVPLQAAVETCTLAMMVQPPEDPLEPTSSNSGLKGVPSSDLRPSSNPSPTGSLQPVPRRFTRPTSPESWNPMSRRWPTQLLNDLDLDCRVPSLVLTVPEAVQRNDSDPLSETLSESIRNCLNIEMLMSVDITIGGARVVSTVSEGSLSDLAELPSPPAQDPAAQKEALAEALREVELDTAILNWCNFQMTSGGAEAAFTDLKSDIQAGAKLIQLLHMLFPELAVPEYHQDPKTGAQWRTNVTAAFGMLRRVRALRPHLLVNHIVLGKRRAILDFCWDVVEATLSLRLWRRIGIAPDDTATEGLVGLNRGELLCWLQALTERCNVCLSDFSGSWADGTALLAVVDRLDPAAGHWATLAALSPEERTVACMEVAERVFSVPKLVEAAQLIRGAENAVILYVSELILAAQRP